MINVLCIDPPCPIFISDPHFIEVNERLNHKEIMDIYIKNLKDINKDILAKINDKILRKDFDEVIVKKWIKGGAFNYFFSSMLERACEFLEEGIYSVPEIDSACARLGIKGVFYIADMNDLAIYEELKCYRIKELVRAGRRGKLWGRGFYSYISGDPYPPIHVGLEVKEKDVMDIVNRGIERIGKLLEIVELEKLKSGISIILNHKLISRIKW